MDEKLKDLRKQREIHRLEIQAIQEEINRINAEISAMTCPFNVGDQVVDVMNKKWQIEKILFNEGRPIGHLVLDDSFTYWGRFIKKDGSLGKMHQMYNEPFTKIEQASAE